MKKQWRVLINRYKSNYYNKLIGISLKQMAGNATLTINNVDRTKKYDKKYEGYVFSNKSIDGYIKLSGNKTSI